MKDFEFGAMNPALSMPTHKRTTTVLTVFLYLVVLIALIRVKTHPVRLSSAGAMQAGIAAYVESSGGAAGASAPKPLAEPKKSIAPRATKPAPKDDQSDAAQSAGAAGVPGGQQGGPVRLGSGGNLTLLNKVKPVYPSIMQSARVPGQVVLDAIIHSDGTIGDITVLHSTNQAFEQAAIVAVKQWRYAPIPYEGIVTVTVNFTMQ